MNRPIVMKKFCEPCIKYAANRNSSGICGLLLPLLLPIRPQVEDHLTKECVKLFAFENGYNLKLVEKPCPAIAVPIADCLIREAEQTNNVLKVISEVASKRYGEGAETVTKRRIAKSLNIPVDSLKEIPLAELFNTKKRVPDDKVCSKGDKQSSPQMRRSPPLFKR